MRLLAYRWVVCTFLLAQAPLLPAQIGGKTAADGPFALDDVEDLDLVADGVLRDWVYGTLTSGSPSLQAIPLSSSGLTLAPGQTPIGALRFQVEAQQGFLGDSFGVPMPSQPGASTLTNPGNITSFTHLVFLACFSPVIPGQVFNVILETYPGPTYPKVYWSFTPASGSTFQSVYIDLRLPGLIENAGSLTLEQLLAQTRYLSFYCYAATGSGPPVTLTLNVDDIRLLNLPAGSPTPTPAPSPTGVLSMVPPELWDLY